MHVSVDVCYRHICVIDTCTGRACGHSHGRAYGTMRSGVRTGVRVGMCMGMCVGICMDMCVDMRKRRVHRHVHVLLSGVLVPSAVRRDRRACRAQFKGWPWRCQLCTIGIADATIGIADAMFRTCSCFLAVMAYVVMAYEVMAAPAFWPSWAI